MSPHEYRKRNIFASENRKALSQSARTSDLKKTNSFLRRLKEFKPESLDAILTDLVGLNLKRYVSECTTAVICAILDGKAKISDVEFLGIVCSELHVRYDNVEIEILTCIKKKWGLQNADETSFDSKASQRNKCMIRFICEIYRIGLTSEWRIFRWVLSIFHSNLPGLEKISEVNATDPVLKKNIESLLVIMEYLCVLVRSVGCCLFGAEKWPGDSTVYRADGIEESDIFGFVSTENITHDIAQRVAKFITDGSEAYNALTYKVKEMWMKSLKTIKNVGDLSDSQREQFETIKNYTERLFSYLDPLTKTFPSCKRDEFGLSVNIQRLPTLEEMVAENERECCFHGKASNLAFFSGLSSFYSPDMPENDINMYDSLREQQFYESSGLVEIKIEEQLQEFSLQIPFECTEEQAIRNIDNLLLSLGTAFAFDAEKGSDSFFDSCISKGLSWCEAFLNNDALLFKYRKLGDRDQGKSFLLSAKKKLLRCIREIDYTPGSAAGVCLVLSIISQGGQRDLSDASQKASLDFEEVVFTEIRNLSSEKTKESDVLAKCLFLCEGVKFRFISPVVLLRLFETFADRQNSVHIRRYAPIVYGCLTEAGKFLARHPLACHKFKDVLQALSKPIRSIGGELEIQLSGIVSQLLSDVSSELASGRSYSAMRRQVTQKVLTLEEQYLQHLIYFKMTDSTEMDVAEKLLMMNWTSREFQMAAFKILRKSHRLSFEAVSSLSRVIKVLENHDKDFIGILIVDDIIERCRQDLDGRYIARSAQKRVRDMYFFTQLFIAGVADESTFFYVLYMICSYRATAETLSDYSRLRLIIQLLDAFNGDNGEEKPLSTTTLQRLRFFLTHFYRLIHSKEQPFPIELNISLSDTIEKMKKIASISRIKIENFPNSFQQANETVKRFMHKIRHARSSCPEIPNGQKSQCDGADPVHSYIYYFEDGLHDEIHPVHEHRLFDIENGSDNSDCLSVNSDESLSSSDLFIDEDTTLPDKIKDFEAVQITAEAHIQEPTRAKSTRASNGATGDLEFDKLLKDITKESFSAIRQQNSIKAMSGRRVSAQSMHLTNLRRMSQSKLPSEAIGVIDEAKETVSMAIAVRQKIKTREDGSAPENRSSRAPGVAFHILQVPRGASMTMQQSLNIEEARKERDEIKRATQSIVSSME